jgi:predicted transcriptional regulator
MTGTRTGTAGRSGLSVSAGVPASARQGGHPAAFFTPETETLVFDLRFRQGWKVAAIATHLGCSESTVYKLLKGGGSRPGRREAKFHNAQVRDQAKRLSALGWKGTCIAELLGCSLTTVSTLLSGPDHQPTAIDQPHKPPEPTYVVKAFIETGSVDVVAAMIGGRADVVARTLIDAGVAVPADQTPVGRRAEAVRLYLQNANLSEVAKAIGRSQTWTYTALAEAKVLRPSGSRRSKAT